MAQKIKRKKSFWTQIHENKTFVSVENIVLPLVFGVLILVLWQTKLLHHMLHTDTFTLPLPSHILDIMLHNGAKIWTNVEATVIVAVVGLCLGSLVGYLIAVIACVFPVWGGSGVIIIAAFNAIPIVALAPVMTNWTKDFSSDPNIRSMLAKILVVMIVCMANMSINAYMGLSNLKPFAEDLMQSFAAKKRVTLFKLRIPNSIPNIFTALKVAVPASVISALVSEYFAEYVIGVGRQIRENIVMSQYATAWAYITAACLIGIIMYAILMLAEALLMKKR